MVDIFETREYNHVTIDYITLFNIYVPSLTFFFSSSSSNDLD